MLLQITGREMESHTTFHLGKILATFTTLQKQHTINKGCRFNSCFIFLICSRREIKARKERQHHNLMTSMN